MSRKSHSNDSYRIRSGEVPRYTGMVDCAQRILKEQGLCLGCCRFPPEKRWFDQHWSGDHGDSSILNKSGKYSARCQKSYGITGLWQPSGFHKWWFQAEAVGESRRNIYFDPAKPNSCQVSLLGWQLHQLLALLPHPSLQLGLQRYLQEDVSKVQSQDRSLLENCPQPASCG